MLTALLSSANERLKGMELIDAMIAVAEKDPSMLPCHAHCSKCGACDLLSTIEEATAFREKHAECPVTSPSVPQSQP